MKAILGIGAVAFTLTASVADAGWSGARMLPGPRLGKPSCVSAYTGIIDCFATGEDRQLHQIRWTGTGSAHYALGGPGQFLVTDSVSCVTSAPSRISCFVISRSEFGSGAVLWHLLWDGNLWRRWESLGGPLANSSNGHPYGPLNLTGQPSCVSARPNTLNCFMRASDGATMHRSWDGWSWGAWESLGGVIRSNPSCTSRSAGLIDCFGIGTDLGLWRRWFDGTSWHGWDSLGALPRPDGGRGLLQFDPACVSYAGAGSIHCFVIGSAALTHRFFANNNWSAWQTRGGETINGQPSCAAVDPNRIVCVAERSTGVAGQPSKLSARVIGGPGGAWEDLSAAPTRVFGSTTCISAVFNRVDCFMAPAKAPDIALGLLTWTP